MGTNNGVVKFKFKQKFVFIWKFFKINIAPQTTWDRSRAVTIITKLQKKYKVTKINNLGPYKCYQ